MFAAPNAIAIRNPYKPLGGKIVEASRAAKRRPRKENGLHLGTRQQHRFVGEIETHFQTVKNP